MWRRGDGDIAEKSLKQFWSASISVEYVCVESRRCLILRLIITCLMCFYNAHCVLLVPLSLG